MPRPKKRVKLSPGEDELKHSDSAPAEQLTGGLDRPLVQSFEPNKKRENNNRPISQSVQHGDSEDDSSSSEDEDDQGELVTEALDSEIMATLKALKSKDPSIYDKTKSFYSSIDDEGQGNFGQPVVARKDAKPMYLSDYHRQNYLAGNIGSVDDDSPEAAVPVQTYDQEQEALRRSVVKAMHGEVRENDGLAGSDSDGDGALLIKKSKPAQKDGQMTRSKTVLDVENADRDPETFLSNFMTSRAWVPEEGSRFANLDEDDSEEERLAETFEEAYNLRFEDPAGANEKMMTYARDVGKYSARRDGATGRKQNRDKKKEAKDQIKAERERETARRRNLKIDDVEHKVKQIREAAGIGPTEAIDLDEWRTVLDDDFDDEKWEEVMAKKYGDVYYATKGDDEANDSDEGQGSKQHGHGHKHKKPKWNDDIDVADIAPELHDESEGSDDDDVNDAAEGVQTKRVDTQVRPSNPQDKKRAARQQRAAIEALVDDQMLGESAGAVASNEIPAMTGFRYRETSPGAFGLSARDILFASDKHLNEFASMKKHHAFRDEERKRKDRKKLNTRAQRQWRKEVFGTEEGYKGEFADYVREQEAGDEVVAARKQKSGGEAKSDKDRKRTRPDEQAADEGKGKKKRRRKARATSEA